MQKLLNKSEFAALAGVNPSTITRVAKTVLSAAMDGDRVDAAHPAAKKYLEGRARATAPETAPGIDPLYNDAVVLCEEHKRATPSFLQRRLRIGYNRAATIIGIMTANGLVEETDGVRTWKGSEKPVVPPPKEKPREPHVRGWAAKRETEKAEEAATYGDEPIEVPEDVTTFADMTLRELIAKFGTDKRFVDWLAALQKIEMIEERQIKNATAKGRLISRELVLNGIIDPINSAHLKLMQDGAKNIAAGIASKVAAGYSPAELDAHAADVISTLLRPVKDRLARAVKNA